MLYLQRCLLFYIHTKKNQTNNMHSILVEICIEVVGLKTDEIYRLRVNLLKLLTSFSYLSVGESIVGHASRGSELGKTSTSK